MKINKFAWLPTIVKVFSGRSALIWMQSYWVQSCDNLPILCDCDTYPCVHTNIGDTFKYPEGKIGIFSFEF